MIKCEKSLSQIKDAVKNMYLKPVEVVLNLGRNKTVKFFATVNGVYPALFTVSPTDKSFRVKTSYAYSECLCGNVKLKEVKNP
ncbi:MAG: Veg family protein [Clostridia bacterium]|nr:Veg family protein [Clostridia bacterium]